MPGEPVSPVVAPTLAAFRRQNFEMQNCISNYPLCVPYRGIFMSGRWPQQTGLMGNGHALKPSEHGLGSAFQQAGYHTGYIGKWHLNGGEGQFVPAGPNRFGFEDWQAWGQTNNHYHAPTWNPDTGEEIKTDGWGPTLMTDQALTFLKSQPHDKPWLLVVSWNPPHPPFNPPVEDQQPYGDSPEFRPNVRLIQSDGTKAHWPELKDEPTLHHAERGYYGGITGVDKEFARILKALDENGQADNTIVIYTSDHGEMMGAHCRMSKQVPWEESCHVPFYIRIPGSTKPRGSASELFAAIDVYPTLCGLAGIPVPQHCQGRDMSGVMRGHASLHPSEGVIVMSERGGASMEENDIPSYRGIRTATHTYAIIEDGRWCLYDNVADPFQMKNLVDDPSQTALMKRLEALILDWQKAVGDKFPLEAAAANVSKYPS